MWRSSQRVRVHLVDPAPGVTLPSVEGVLISKRGRELVLAVPALVVSPGGKPVELADARYLSIPRERIAFWEIVR